jgi:hypothetical protein
MRQNHELEKEFVAFMSRDGAQPFIETARVKTAFIRGQLDKLAAALPALRDCPLYKIPAQTGAPVIRGDANGFYLPTPRA